MVEKEKMISRHMDEAKSDEDRVMKMLKEELRKNGDINDNELILGNKDFEESNPKIDDKNHKIESETENPEVDLLQTDDEYLLSNIEKDLRAMKLGADVIDLGRFGRYPRGESNHDGDWVSSNRIFGTVSFVMPGSPADEGGLHKNDELIEFGYLSVKNFTDIHQLQNVVRLSIGRPLHIKVKRGRQLLNIGVIPRHWEKPGLVGCKIIKHRCGLELAN
ncbi:unnamed protein product [Euphydryas editha]|uniref:26S proteasome non-ATPase regulatory subunit 9 n=1 Tax=Euphydryas editha TaxID=104508 RepID=A0AAU9UF77_EUPED|nr:unnamed protein product [Euphydryas editha]